MITSQNIRPTPCSSGRHGSTANVAGSGIAIMSDSSIALKPVIDEPSKPIPDSNASSSSSTLIENDFSWPRMSVNQKRMKRISRSATIALTSSAVFGESGIGVTLPMAPAQRYRRMAKASARAAAGQVAAGQWPATAATKSATSSASLP